MSVRKSRQGGVAGPQREIIPKGFADERALVEDIAQGCRGQKVLMITGNYTVKHVPGTDPEDPRLLGPNMLLTIELCAHVSRRCAEVGIERPSIMLLPNDIAPGVFPDFHEGQSFKANYSIPDSISTVLAAGGITSEPVFLFNRWFDRHGAGAQSRMRAIKRQIAEGYEKLIVVFESYAQNLGAKMLSRGALFRPGELSEAPDKSRIITAPVTIKDSFSGSVSDSDPEVTITNPNGAPFCSFLAATMFLEFEKLGYTHAVNAFVTEEYPCVDKAAAAYKHIYGGKMPIRNIYLEGKEVLFDNTI